MNKNYKNTNTKRVSNAYFRGKNKNKKVVLKKLNECAYSVHADDTTFNKKLYSLQSEILEDRFACNSDSLLSHYIKHCNAQKINDTEHSFVISRAHVEDDSFCIHYDITRQIIILYGDNKELIQEYMTEYFTKEYNLPFVMAKQDKDDELFDNLYDEVVYNQKMDMYMTKSKYMKTFKVLILPSDIYGMSVIAYNAA